MKTGNKRLIALLCAVLVLVGLVGCGKQPIETIQDRAVEIGQQFLAGKLTEAEAKEKLDSLMVPEAEGNGQTYLQADIDYLSFIICKNGSTYEDVQEKVDWIAGFDYTE
jgi:hypothetical protein